MSRRPLRATAALPCLLLAISCAAPPPPAPAPPRPQALPATGAAPPTIVASPRAEPAPVPDRDIEAPPDPLTDALAPRLEPMLLPPDRNQGVTFGREHLRDAAAGRSLESILPGARLPIDSLVPGARLRIPFE